MKTVTTVKVARQASRKAYRQKLLADRDELQGIVAWMESGGWESLHNIKACLADCESEIKRASR